MPWGLGALKEGMGTGEGVCGGAGEAGKWSVRSPSRLAMRCSVKWAPALPQRPDMGSSASAGAQAALLAPRVSSGSVKASRLITGVWP